MSSFISLPRYPRAPPAWYARLDPPYPFLGGERRNSGFMFFMSEYLTSPFETARANDMIEEKSMFSLTTPSSMGLSP